MQPASASLLTRAIHAAWSEQWNWLHKQLQINRRGGVWVGMSWGRAGRMRIAFLSSSGGLNMYACHCSLRSSKANLEPEVKCFILVSLDTGGKLGRVTPLHWLAGWDVRWVLARFLALMWKGCDAPLWFPERKARTGQQGGVWIALKSEDNDVFQGPTWDSPAAVLVSAEDLKLTNLLMFSMT